MLPPSPSSPVFFEAASRTGTMLLSQPASAVETLDQLQTPQQVQLLDKIDELRSQGLGHHGISLPQLVVCGDQSSGKSSLLEGLTRLRFPAKEACCTRFATEVVLRREVDTEISCTIIPSKSRSQAERRELAKFKHTFTSREAFSFLGVVDEAMGKMALGLKDDRDSFFEDVLRVRYTGPDLPSLTIVDLPGMIVTQLNGGNGAERVANLVKSYMQDEKSIILAVVQAGNHPENQEVFRYLKEFDPLHSRTLGIITKPDKVDRGGDEEKELVSLVKNEAYPLKYRWHAVRNRSHVTREQSDTERDETERQFFATGLWSSLPREDVGIATLRPKLSRMLLEHITKELPSIMTALQGAIAATQSSLKTLGDARETDRQRRTYLTEHAEKFQILTHDALRGIYTNPFFALSSSPTEQTPTRLRTEIQNLNLAFANVIYRKGHTWNITEDQIGDSRSSTSMNTARASSMAIHEYDAVFNEPSYIDRSKFLNKHIGDYVHQSRPSGLPSLVNPWVIGEVFRQQSRSWKDIAQHHLRCTFQAVEKYIEKALGVLMDSRTCRMLMHKHVQPELDQRWKDVEAKLDELLVPYTKQDPITYDPTFIRELEETRAARYHAKTGPRAPAATPNMFGGQAAAPSMFGGQAAAPSMFGGQATAPFGFGSSAQQLLTESVDDFTNSEILDLMQTYYKRAITVFISNVTVLAIENCLTKDLSAIFSSSLVASMEDEKLHAIASESEETRAERSALKEKLVALESGKQILNEHIASTPALRASKPPSFGSRHDTRPRTPSSRQNQYDQTTQPNEAARMSSSLNSFVVTPPSSESNTPEPSHHRGEFDTTTPKPPKRRARKRSPLPGPSQSNASTPAVKDGTDEEW